MKRNGERMYLGRKLGSGMGVGYIVRALVPALLVLLVTAILVFSYVFISSMTSAIDRMIMVLGSGTLTVYDETLPEGLPSSWDSKWTTGGDGILYTAGGETLVHLKGVGDDYFDGERGELLKLTKVDTESRNRMVVSSTLAGAMGLSPGDRLTLLLYEEAKNRTRPILMTVEGVFSSGYTQLDRYMAYVPQSLLGDGGEWEILLPDGADVASAQELLFGKGVYSASYRTRYSTLYTNVRQSVMILYVILLVVAVLAAFFSVDMALVYLDRDRRDIASLRLLGMGEKRIRAIYVKMTLSAVAVAGTAGTALGLILGMLSPSVMEFLAVHFPVVVENYISSFTLKVPFLPILLMLLLLLLSSWVSLTVSLRFSSRRELSGELHG